MRFHTRFDVARTLNADKQYDTHDNVDRVSYVDSTRLVERFILEGHNLNAVRAKALRSGLYSGDLKEIFDEDSGLAMPVYAQDPAISDAIIREQNSLRQSRAAYNNDDSNDDKSAAPTVTESSPDNSESKA